MRAIDRSRSCTHKERTAIDVAGELQTTALNAMVPPLNLTESELTLLRLLLQQHLDVGNEDNDLESLKEKADNAFYSHHSLESFES